MTPAVAQSQAALLVPFLKRMAAFEFGLNEIELLNAAAAAAEQRDAGSCIREESDETRRPFIVASGCAAYTRVLRDGRQQIFAVILPGDTIGLARGLFAHGGTAVLALTPMRLLDATKLAAALGSDDAACPNLRSALEFERGLQEVRLLDQVIRLGRLTSIERLAHFVLEIRHRLDRAGLVSEGTFSFPFTQMQLGQALGLSLVHVNRTMQALRREGIEIKSGRARVPDLEELEHLAGL